MLADFVARTWVATYRPCHPSGDSSCGQLCMSNVRKVRGQGHTCDLGAAVAEGMALLARALRFDPNSFLLLRHRASNT